MPDPFLSLRVEDRFVALEQATANSIRPIHLIEKDIWVVWVLNVLFESSFGKDLIFKGGTSLSKAYQVISRFSEDVDLTYSIRAIAPDLVRDHDEALPPSRSQEQRWTKLIRERLAGWIRETVAPLLAERAAGMGLPAQITMDDTRLYFAYEPIVVGPGSGYVSPVVLLEFGARATGEPFETRTVVCDAAEHVPDVSFPQASPNVMRPERTFWEKATAMHVFCHRGRLRTAERFSRHWYDAVCLDETGHAAAALADRGLAGQVARHKTMFHREKNASGAVIDYHAAVQGALQLVPRPAEADWLGTDYVRMVGEGVLFCVAPSFEALMARCRDIERRANG